MGRVRETIIAMEKLKLSHICLYVRASVCARACVYVALLIQHATRMRHIVMLFVAPLAVPHFSALSNKRHEFRENKL
jgi:hypothetical protein